MYEAHVGYNLQVQIAKALFDKLQKRTRIFIVNSGLKKQNVNVKKEKSRVRIAIINPTIENLVYFCKMRQRVTNPSVKKKFQCTPYSVTRSSVKRKVNCKRFFIKHLILVTSIESDRSSQINVT